MATKMNLNFGAQHSKH